MTSEAPKPAEWSEELLADAVSFHCGRSPFPVVGLRMGLVALRRLRAQGWFDIRCSVRVRGRPPDSCVIDGIHVSSGCTAGRGNLQVGKGDGVSADFERSGKRLRVALGREVLRRIRGALGGGGEVEALTGDLIAVPDSELFDIS